MRAVLHISAAIDIIYIIHNKLLLLAPMAHNTAPWRSTGEANTPRQANHHGIFERE
jgi:hypothetical protein